MSGLIGRKIGMSNIFNSLGELVPVTVILAGPCKVVSVRTKQKDGYEALQLGFGEKKEKKISKPVSGQFKKNNLSPSFVLKEFKFPSSVEFKIGDEVKVDLFKEGEGIKVRGLSKGKGFQGVMRRHNFGGVGGTTHGQSDRLRAPGSIGGSSYPSRVFKGQRMAGRTGHSNITVSNLKVVRIVPEENLILIKGAVPGAINSIVELIKP
ncbi:MAG: 50S ribosomal protein L3 [Ignavibacteria bacterium RBG_16_34_14]|nr:MAG: 50S ribosomal protein L3 [Ignavibacteria bacterium RBG_16_34_14]